MESLSRVLQAADLGKQRGGSFLFLHRCAYNIAPHIHLRTYIDTALSLHSHSFDGSQSACFLDDVHYSFHSEFDSPSAFW